MIADSALRRGRLRQCYLLIELTSEREPIVKFQRLDLLLL
jgi:hypothetical protein